MLCGLTRILSRIKHLLFFSFSRKYRPFDTNKCHQCLWCKFFDDCKREHEYLLNLDDALHRAVLIGEPVELSDENSFYQWMKTHKDRVYGSSLSDDESENLKKFWDLDNSDNRPMKDHWWYIDLSFMKDHFEGYKK